MTYTAKIEQTKDYKKRMHYMPNTYTFEEKDCDSLSNIRNVPFPSGWIKESGTPPCSHLDVIVVTDEPCELGVKPDCMDDAVAIAESYVKFGKKEDIKIIGIRHGEKMYETLLTNEECAKAEDMGNFYRVPADNRGLNYDKFFKEGEVERNKLTEFNSNNTRILNVEETKEKIAALEYIQKELTGEGNFVQ